MGEIELFDIEKEYDLIVKKVKEQYGYDDDLCSVLRKILPAMLTGKSYEERNIFYQMLQETPIIVAFEDEDIEEMSNKMFAGINPHIIEEEEKESVYNKSKPSGFFIRTPILDESLNLTGKKQAIFVKKRDTSKPQYGTYKERVELFGTGIQVSHLIHELGHAWHSQKNGLTQAEDGSILSRMGNSTTRYTYTRLEDGKYLCHVEPTRSLITEEAMNSDMEEQALKRFLGIDDEKLKKLYSSGVLIKSNYQKSALLLLRSTMRFGIGTPLGNYRINGEDHYLDKTNQLLAKTAWYQNREKQTETTKTKEQIIDILKRGDEILEDGSIVKIGEDREKKIEKRRMFAELIKDDFFGSKEGYTPLEYFDNLLTQAYDINTDFLTFTLPEYKALIEAISTDIRDMLVQAIDVKKTEIEKSGKTEQK